MERRGRALTQLRTLTVAVAAVLAVAGCGGGDSSSGPDLKSGPTHVWWENYQGVSLPRADQGPKKIDTGAALGFDHSPVGAALAAVLHTVRISIAPDDQWARIVAAEVAPGKGRDEYAINRVQYSINGPADPKTAPRVRGYRITEYRDDRALVDVFTSYPDNSLAVNHTQVVWSTEDWRLVLADSSSATRPIDALTELPKDWVKLEGPAT